MESEFVLNTCITCGSKAYENSNTKYCINCGDKLYNYCSNKDCNIEGEVSPLPATAKYCPFCGEKTIIYDYTLVQQFENYIGSESTITSSQNETTYKRNLDKIDLINISENNI